MESGGNDVQLHGPVVGAKAIDELQGRDTYVFVRVCALARGVRLNIYLVLALGEVLEAAFERGGQ